MMIHPSYKKPKINSGNLRTPVQFWRFVPNDGPEPMEEKKEKLYECLDRKSVV